RGFVALAPWDKRKGDKNSAASITRRATQTVRRLRDAEFFALNPPPVRGLGQSSGFTMELLNSSGMSRADFTEVRNKVLDAARRDPVLTSVRTNSLDDTPPLNVN